MTDKVHWREVKKLRDEIDRLRILLENIISQDILWADSIGSIRDRHPTYMGQTWDELIYGKGEE